MRTRIRAFAQRAKEYRVCRPETIGQEGTILGNIHAADCGGFDESVCKSSRPAFGQLRDFLAHRMRNENIG